MTKIEELRQKAAENKMAMARTIQEVASAVIKEESSVLSILNNMDKTEGNTEQSGDVTVQIENIATKIANRVADNVTDPVNKFLQVCAQKGLNKYRIAKAVDGFAAILGVEADSYDKRLELVASIIEQEKPHMYNDISMYNL